MGLLSGFVGGVAKATGQVADQRISRYTAEMIAEQRDLAEQAKELRIVEFTKQAEERMATRQDAVSVRDRQGRIDDAKTLRDTQFAFENDPANVSKRIDTSNLVSAGAAKGARENQIEGLNDQGLIAAQAGAFNRDREQKNNATIADAGNKPLLDAQTTILLLDPRIKAAVAASFASAGASAAQAKLAGEQFTQTVEVGKRAIEVRGLQTQLAAATDKTEREKIQQKLGDLGFAGKDPTKFLGLAEKAQDNVLAALKVMMDPMADPATKAAAALQMERANDLATQAAAMGGIKPGAATSPFAIPGAKGGKGADPYEKPKADAAAVVVDPAKKIDNAPAKYGLLSGPRMGYLEGLSKAGTINAAEKQELDALIASKSTAWFRGRASEQD